MKNHILFSTHNNCYLYSCRHKVGKAVCGERTGQRAVIRLSGFSEQEYGRMEGKVVSISPVPNEEGNYVAEIGLIRMPDKQPPLLKVMDGTAEIIIREQSLLERLFNH